MSAPGVTPVPESATSTVVLEPLTVIDKVPLLVPADPGANCTPKVLLWLGARVSGKLRPVMLKPGPEAEAAVTVRLVPPVFFKVSVCV